MPTLPSNTKCIDLGCKNPRSKCNSHCLEHGGYDTYTLPKSKERNEFNNMYSTKQWKQLRRLHLSKNPLCMSCLNLGRVIQATQVDHVFPWSWLGKEAFYRNIFQTLCIECHSHKTALEQKNIIRFYNKNNIIDYRLSDYSSVINDLLGKNF